MMAQRNDPSPESLAFLTVYVPAKTLSAAPNAKTNNPIAAVRFESINLLVKMRI
jgi:hypothetical protein